MIRTGGLTLLAAVLLTGCAPILKSPTPQQFAATTQLQEERVLVSVTNLGPSNLWLDPNHCPGKFKVGVQKNPPSMPSLLGDACVLMLFPAELWKVGEAKVGMLANTLLPPGTYTVTAWPEPKGALDSADPFQTVRVQASPVVLTVPK